MSSLASKPHPVHDRLVRNPAWQDCAPQVCLLKHKHSLSFLSISHSLTSLALFSYPSLFLSLSITPSLPHSPVHLYILCTLPSSATHRPSTSVLGSHLGHVLKRKLQQIARYYIAEQLERSAKSFDPASLPLSSISVSTDNDENGGLKVRD